MQRKQMKQIGIWILIVILAIILIQVVISIAKSIKKPEELVFNVNTVKLQKQKLQHILTVQGILEGDPQVKVYPQVPGKFAKNVVAEGDSVKKEDVLAYLDRDMVGYKYELAPVKSPASGIVTKLYYTDKGDAVSPEMPVAEIGNEDNVKVVFNLGQDDLLKVHKGQPVQIFFVDDPAISIDGEVFSVPPVVDTDIMAGTVVVKAPNKAKTMKIGMSVNVEILTGETDSYMIPERAVLLGEDFSYVYIDKSGKATQAKVTTGMRQNDLIEIAGPLADGDEVVTDGNFKLFEGAKLSAASSQVTLVPVTTTTAVK